MKYYKVNVKCGHVKRNNFLLKDIAVEAFNGKEAARIARYKGRVKHDQKDAIRSVEEICENDYKVLRYENRHDAFFCCRNKQEQSYRCLDIFDYVQREEDKEDYDNDRIDRILNRNKTKYILERKYSHLYDRVSQ